MQDREKKLAVALAGVLALAGGMSLIDGWFLQPIAQQRGTLSSAQASIETQMGLRNELELARRKLDDWRYESLPPDRNTAQRLYLIWLESLARISGLTSIEPDFLPVGSRGADFVEIPVQITAKATLEQLARFLYHSERVALLHRIESIEIESPASIGNPLLDVTLECRGLALTDAPQRYQLFSFTTLSKELSAEDTELVFETDEGFPLIDGFQVRIDQELVTVRERGEDQWTIERGAERTLAVAHEAGAKVELFPVDRSVMTSDRTFEYYRELIANSPFAKPSPPSDYRPELSPNTEQVVTRGTAWTQTMTLSGWDPDGGEAMYSLGADVPPGMTIHPRSGELYWNPDEEIEAKVYDVPILAKSTILSEQRVELVLPVKLREPNLPPTITELETQNVFSGRLLTIDVEADDPDGDNDQMAYSLTGEVPTGAEIDAATGQLKWLPPLTLELGEYKLTVSVADGGDPQQTTTQELTIVLEDDAALFTKLIGIFGPKGDQEVLLKNMTTDETTQLYSGGVLKAADVEGTVVAVEPRHILLKIGSETFRLDLGDNLRQMTPVAPTSTAAPAATETPSG